MDGAPEPDCTRCRHFYVTWRTPHTKGCRAYGFESESYPSIAVLRESGAACRLFERKELPVAKDAREDRAR